MDERKKREERGREGEKGRREGETGREKGTWERKWGREKEGKWRGSGKERLGWREVERKW